MSVRRGVETLSDPLHWVDGASQDRAGLLIQPLPLSCRRAAVPTDNATKVKKVFRSATCSPKISVSSAGRLNTSCNEHQCFTPVQFVVQVNTQVLIRVHYLSVSSLDVLCCGCGGSAEIHQQLRGFLQSSPSLVKHIVKQRGSLKELLVIYEVHN